MKGEKQGTARIKEDATVIHDKKKTGPRKMATSGEELEKGPISRNDGTEKKKN